MIDWFGIIISAIYIFGIIATCSIIEHKVKDYNKQESCVIIIASLFWIIFWIIYLINFFRKDDL